jgi:alkyl hydroperoxide reductase subunit F
MMYDVAIIGGGPAGLTAAIYAVRKKLKTIVIGGSLGGQAALTGEIQNYLGFSLITGPELITKFRDHVKSYKDLELLEGVRAKKIMKLEDGHHFEILIDNGRKIQTKTVIMSTGEKPRELHVPGEREFTGKGVSYCATCDGPLFHGKDVVVVGGGNSGVEAALEIAAVAKKVFVVQNQEALTADAVLVENLNKKQNVEILLGAGVTKIEGTNLVSGVVVSQAGAKKTLACQGVFVEIGWIPASDLVLNLLALNEKNEIKIDKDTHTNVPGIFACGDVTDVHDKQIIIAAGEGAKAAISAFKYLIQRNDFE